MGRHPVTKIFTKSLLWLPLAVAVNGFVSPVHASGKWDGKWIGEKEVNVIQGSDCDVDLQILAAEVQSNTLHLEFSNNAKPLKIKVPIDANGEVLQWVPIEFVRTGGIETELVEQFKLQGVYRTNLFEASLHPVSFSTKDTRYCGLNFILAKSGTAEATSIFTGEDPEVLRLQRKAAKLAASGQLRRANLPETPPVDPSKPYDGVWQGIAKSDDEGLCRITDKLENVTIEDFKAVIKLTSGTVNATVDRSGSLSKWLRVEIRDTSSDNDVSLNAKLDGRFKDGKFEGGFSGNLDGGNVCTATVKLGPKGSIFAEALMAGQNPKLLALQRQIAAAQAAPANDDNEAARAEAAKIAAERKAEESRLAALRAEQEAARAAEEIERAKRRQAEEARLAKLRAEEQKRLTEERRAVERRLATLRAEQERIAEAQKKEAAQLARLKAEAEAKVQELAALERQEVAKQKSNIPANINFGEYHALVIGIDDYKNLKSLKTAVADANAIADVLADKYNFKVTKLLNPSRDDILDTLDDLRATLKFKDNLLVYYAGHGWLDDKADQGYWLASDARKNRRSRWVSNATITDTLKAIESKHVMVVADSCYSGRLVRNASINVEHTDTPEYFSQMSRKKARVVITSGGLEPVEDGKGKHSPFARAFLMALNENDGVIDGAKLFSTIRRPVMVSANQTPQYSDVRRAGHDGGDFLFVRRK